MALSIGIKKNSRVLVGGSHLLVVKEIIAPTQVRVEFDERSILVTDLERAKLMDDVFVSCGLLPPNSTNHYSRLAFEAPREIRIERLTT
jgi:hypothetical protein